MKELNIFIKENDLSKVTDILQKHKAGITFFEIQGTGRTPRVTQEIRTFLPNWKKNNTQVYRKNSCYYYCPRFRFKINN